MSTPGFHGRGAERYARTWITALAAARDLAEEDLPTRSPRVDGPPHPRMWADRDIVADRRFKAARASMLTLAEELNLPVENLLTPDYVRRAMWSPPSTREPAELADALRAQLTAYGARPWQVELVTGALTGAVLAGDVEPSTPEPDA
jgi:ribonuclease D